MNKKNFAIMLISLMLLSIVGIIIYFIQITKLDIIADATVNEETIAIALSFEYQDENTKETRITTSLLLLNPKTQQLGVLELPGYTGVYNRTLDFSVPVDRFYREDGYKNYIEAVAKTFKINNLNYIHVEEDTIENFFDLLGGLKIFLISNDENGIQGETRRTTSTTTGLGEVYFDGPSAKSYIHDMENLYFDDELSKSVRRKELVLAILKKIQADNPVYTNSTLIIDKMHKMVDTSLSTDELKKILLSLSNYNLDQSYFQRISGQIKTIDIPIKENSAETVKEIILFSNTEVGALSKVLDTIELRLSQDIDQENKGNITITILNGTFVNGLAKKCQEIYEAQGFDVVSIGNAEKNDIETTIIIDRIGNKVNSRLVSEVIGIRSIITDITSIDKAGAELTIVLGKDFDGEKIR